MAAAMPPVAVPVRRLRATLRAVVEAVEGDRARVVLTRHGRPVAALVPVGALEALDLLDHLLPGPAAVAAGLRGHEPGAPMPGGPPAAVGPAGSSPLGVPAALRSRLSAALTAPPGAQSPAATPAPEAP